MDTANNSIQQIINARVNPSFDIADDVGGMQIIMVNVFFYGQPGAGDGNWVLIDAGLHMSGGRIIRAAEDRFGPGARPSAIVLTHAHFDHVGALGDLLEYWGDVPVYAHSWELPYLTGRSDYPPPDPTVGGGLMARMAMLYPNKATNFGDRVRPLPEDGTVPGMPGWRWIHTPGHAPGHVSLFRETDRVLIVGDAFVTTKQESAIAVLTQVQEVNGPPKYFTIDWGKAKESVERLAALNPSVAATGHGIPMSGEKLYHGLNQLAFNFERLAVPRDGRYVREPALTDPNGVLMVPPPVADPLPKIAAGVAVGALLLGALTVAGKRRG
jgi:glyoxylase-like metal-dependent hydrolase (beta-lactamase superfamily II)